MGMRSRGQPLPERRVLHLQIGLHGKCGDRIQPGFYSEVPLREFLLWPEKCKRYKMGKPGAVPYKDCDSVYDEGWLDDICTENRDDEE